MNFLLIWYKDSFKVPEMTTPLSPRSMTFPTPTAESISALAVAIGCGVAAAVVGTAAVAFIAKRIMGKKFTTYELLREPLHQT